MIFPSSARCQFLWNPKPEQATASPGTKNVPAQFRRVKPRLNSRLRFVEQRRVTGGKKRGQSSQVIWEQGARSRGRRPQVSRSEIRSPKDGTPPSRSGESLRGW